MIQLEIICIPCTLLNNVHETKQKCQNITLGSNCLYYCNDWSEASGFTCSKMFNEQRQKQTGNGQQAKTGISEAEQRRKQYQAGVEVTGTGSEFQGRAVRGQTQRWQEE